MIPIEKTNIYVSVANQSFSYVPLGAPCEFKLQMEPSKVRAFEKLFLQLNTLELDNAFRAHLPSIPYHLDEANDEIDTRLKKVYALIHEFGDEHTKQFVERLPYYN